ncbi:SAM-dependent methyltransferase [Acrocarpospora catenulata]|uniref:SAM-dependent methyltransferase n=1 Tax=Acrocarpospora catenulata TaxID=2836182 RepID=UPI0020239F13|nr:SAM-dependent methyltransferase [Acrocarpospora catenulata]
MGTGEGDYMKRQNVFDPDCPNASRMYDHLLGGSDNHAPDRVAAEELLKVAPDAADIAVRNRAFLKRAVKYLAEHGVRQFLDIGSGLPTRENVHQMAQAAAPGARVVYVDNDPIVFAHLQAILSDGNTVATSGDMRATEQILADPRLNEVISLDGPVGVILTSVLHFVPDTDGPHDIVARLMRAMPRGSYLVLSHGKHAGSAGEADEARILEIYNRTNKPLYPRGESQIIQFFDGLEIIQPGVVPVQDWRPNGDGPVGRTPVRAPGEGPGAVLGGVAVKIH